MYDPFVLRGLDAFIYGLYGDSRFIVVGTPSGVSLAPEGGAHQSTITPSVGIELPNVKAYEPAYAQALDWVLCDALADLTRPSGVGTYLRLSTRSIDQQPFLAAVERMGEDALRHHVLAGGYVLVAAGDESRPRVNLVASGAVLPEVIDASRILDDEGVAANVIDVTSADELFRDWRSSIDEAARSARASVGLPHRHAVAARASQGADRDRARLGEPRTRLARVGARNQNLSVGSRRLRSVRLDR